MNHQEGFFSGIRNIKTYYQAWLPEVEPRSVLVIVHGLAEHCGRYMNLVNHFLPLGYAVYGFDHIGHGKSEGIRVHVERFEDYTDTLKTFLNMVREWQPDTFQGIRVELIFGTLPEEGRAVPELWNCCWGTRRML